LFFIYSLFNKENYIIYWFVDKPHRNQASASFIGIYVKGLERDYRSATVRAVV